MFTKDAAITPPPPDANIQASRKPLELKEIWDPLSDMRAESGRFAKGAAKDLANG